MELEDCAGFDDSDVLIDGGISGPVNSLLPRFDQEETDVSDRHEKNSAKGSNKKLRLLGSAPRARL